MKLETCVYSGFKIYPGRGTRAVKADGKVNIFFSKKCTRAVQRKRAPRECCWTVLYRMKNRKGNFAQDVHQRKKTKKTVQIANKPVAGLSLEAVLAKRNQTTDFRKQQRDVAAKAAKEANKAARANRQATKEKKPAAAKQAQKAPKAVKTAAPRVGGKR